MTFEKALDELPDVCGLDSHHSTLADLCWLCLHELDLHAEQEYWHPAAVCKKLLAFCEKWGHYQEEARESFAQGRGLKKSDAADHA